MLMKRAGVSVTVDAKLNMSHSHGEGIGACDVQSLREFVQPEEKAKRVMQLLL